MKLSRSDSATSGRPGATLSSLPSRIHRSSRSTKLEEMVEAVHDEEQRLIVIDLGDLVDHPFHLNRVALDFRGLDGVLQLAVRTEQAAAIRHESRAARASARIPP